MHTDGEPYMDLIRGWHPPPTDDNVWSADLLSYIQMHFLETQGKQARKSGKRAVVTAGKEIYYIFVCFFLFISYSFDKPGGWL